MFNPYDEFNNAAGRYSGTGVNAPLDKDGRCGLHFAVEQNDREGLSRLIRIGGKPDQQDKNGQSAVFEAITRQNADMVALLKEKGASLNLADAQKRTPLDWAIEKGCDLEFIAKLNGLGASLDPAIDSKRTPLHVAVQQNRVDLIEYFVKNGVDINAQDATGRTPLFCAVESKSLPAVKKLLELGADPVRRNNDIRTPLHMAALMGYTDGVDALLAETEVRRTINEYRTYTTGFTPLMEAVNAGQVECAAKIAAAGGDVNARDHNKRHALYLAVENGSVECAKLMIALGADVNKGDDGNFNKLVHAISVKSFRPMLALLFQAGADLDAKNGNGQTALNIACENTDKDKARALLELGANPNLANGYGRRPIDAVIDHYSYTYGGGDHNEIIGLLLKSGADPNLSPNAAVPNSPLHIAARNGNVDTLKILVKSRARMDQPGRSNAGVTPLMVAAENGRKEAVDFLISQGADAARKDNYKRGLLHFAARGNATELLEKLLAEKNPGIEDKDARGQTPLHQACRKDQRLAAEILLKAGANPLAIDNEGRTPLHQAIETSYNAGVIEAFKDVLGDKIDWNMKKKDGDTLLHVAARQGQNMSVQTLLDLGADPAIPGKDGLLPLHLSILHGSDWVTGMLVDAMKKNGVSPDQHRDPQGLTALHYAVTRDYMGHAEKLLEAGADLNAKTLTGDTPLHLAVRAGKDEGVRLMLEKGADLMAANAAGETPLDIALAGKREYIARLIVEEFQKRPPPELLTKGTPLVRQKPPAP